MSNLDTIFKVPLSGGGSYPSVVVFTGTKHRVQSPLERWLSMISMISMNRTKMESRPYEFLLQGEAGEIYIPPSLGFSRQEHWSGLPFPSPMHESEK